MDALVLVIMVMVLTMEIWVFDWAVRRTDPNTIFRDVIIASVALIAFGLTCLSVFGHTAKMSA